MINGAHVVIYSKDAEADRKFFRDVFKFDSIDAGNGWLLFALPPSEAAFHPAEDNNDHVLYLMCDDLMTTTAELEELGVTFGKVHQERWGIVTSIQLPGGGRIGLYEPHHPHPSGKKKSK